MEITLDKTTTIPTFLAPISRAGDMCTLTISDGKMSCVTTPSESNIILYGTHKFKTDELIDEQRRLNIGDIKKFIRAFECIPEDTINLKITSNSIQYRSSSIKFKYHLLDDNIMPPIPINPAKIDALEFDMFFKLSTEKIKEVIKGSVFASDTEKIYFYTKDSKVFCELTDNQLDNIDSIGFQIADEYEGTDILDALPINIEILKLFTGLKVREIDVKINTNHKVFMFEISNDITTLKYIISALVK